MQKFEVSAEKLRNTCDPLSFDCGVPEVIDDWEDIIGQERALKAMDFGLRINNKGYNIYMAGINGTGKTSYAKTAARKVAATCKVPNDLCYVYNFKEADRPILIELSPGMGEEFVENMNTLTENVRNEIIKTFAGDEFDKERRVIRDKYQKDSSDLLLELDKIGKEKGFVVRQTSKGLVSVPLIEGKAVDQIEEELITEEITKEIQEKLPEMQKLLDEVTRKIKALEKEATNALANVEKKVAADVIQPEISIVRGKFNGHQKIETYLDDVENDMMDNIKILKVKDDDQPINPLVPQTQTEGHMMRYKVNLFVNNANKEGAPVIYETNPNYYNLFGKVEGKASFGAINTDFTMIKSGSIHKANGGYLILQANEVLKDFFAWDALKRTLKNGETTIENIGEQFRVIPTVTIKPEKIPINIKVILIGSPYIEQLLYDYDDDFEKLFKINAHFDTTMERNQENMNIYFQFINSVCKREVIKELDKSAFAALVEFSSRLSGHQQKLSIRFNKTIEIIYEANAWAEIAGDEQVNASHVEKAIKEKIIRANLYEEKIQESILKGQTLIDLEGSVTGQINGLSVYRVGDYSFGKPSRITAQAYKGKRGVVNIDREVKMTGKIHDKGVLILSGYLGGKYAKNTPLSVTASICFEQNYGGLDGDSASCAELVVLLSAIADIPIRQDLAITGSMNQKGQIQPIGGVNQKIEGFYSLCKEQGFTGTQGVIIPVQNIENLMLEKEVVKDCKNGDFHIYSISHVDEAIELLTDMAPETFHEKIRQKLDEMSRDNDGKDKTNKEKDE